MLEQSINNYLDLFMDYISRPPTFIEALEQLSNYFNLKKTNSIVEESKRTVDRNFDKIKKNYPNISKEESMIIASYTIGIDISRILYKALNEDKKNIKHISKYLYIFIKSLRKLKKYYPDSKYLYRGIRIKENSLIKGNKKIFYSFISTGDINIAKSFASNGTIFSFGGKVWGYDISLFNCFGEKEILLEPERQFLIEEVISLDNVINVKLKMIDTPLVLEDIIPYEIYDINDLKIQLQNEKIKNIELNKKIEQLENKNKEYEQKINLLQSELNINHKNKNQNISKDNQNNNILNAVLEKDKEIKELRLKISRYPIQLEEGENLISVIFVSADQKVHYSIICKNTSKFSIIEGKLYEIYNEYEESETYFTVNGKRVNRHKTMDDNNIKNNDIIMLNVVEFD